MLEMHTWKWSADFIKVGQVTAWDSGPPPWQELWENTHAQTHTDPQNQGLWAGWPSHIHVFEAPH